MNPFIYSSAIELASMIRDGIATSTQIVKAHLDQIKKHNEKLHAIVQLYETGALLEAAMCDEEIKKGKLRGPLHGVPFTVKEQFWVKGTKSTLNTKRLKDWIAPEDAEFVKRIKAAGGILMGKTNAAKDLLDYQTCGDIYPESKNPYDSCHTPGGSSGGAAVALASGMTPLEMGGDFGGSVRIPANFCGIYGLRPTDHTISAHGNVPIPEKNRGYIFDMAVSGPMARTPEDLELLWKIVIGPDKKDRRIQPIQWKNSLGKKITDFKIAWVDAWPGFDTSRQTKQLIWDLVGDLEMKNVNIDLAPPPDNLYERSLDIYKKLSLQMITQELPWFIKALLIGSMKRKFLKGMKKVPWTLRDSFLDYSANTGERAAITRDWENYFEKYDLLICPAGFGPAFRRCKMGDTIRYDNTNRAYIHYVWPYHAWVNASGHPAMNFPLGLNKEGLPVGIQIVGPYWSEPDLIQFAKCLDGMKDTFVRPKGF